MPVYKCIVRNAEGKVRTTAIEATDKEQLAYRLQERGFEIESMEEVDWHAAEEVPGLPIPRRHNNVRVSQSEVLVFWIQFSIMIDKDVSPIRAMDIAAERAASMRFATVLKDVALQVCGGVPLHQALAHFPNVFDAATVGIIHAGETANALSDAVHRLIQFMERDRATARDRRRG